MTGEIAIATRAVGLHRGEIGWEVSGLVTRAGGELQVGDPVMGVIDHGGDLFMGVGDHGASIEQMVAPADRFVRLPAGWSFEQGAAFPVSYLCAYELLRVRGRARRGTRVLVQGADGPVGQATVQLGRALGCELVETGGRGVDLVIDLLDESDGVLGVDLDHVLGDPARLRQRFGEILELPGVIPAVGALFPFERAREAVALQESGRSVGKVVLAVDPP